MKLISPITTSVGTSRLILTVLFTLLLGVLTSSAQSTEDQLKTIDKAIRQTRDRVDKGNLMLKKADLLKNVDRFDESVASAREALGLFQASRDLAGQIKTYMVLGYTHKKAKNYSEAIQSLKNAEPLLQSIGDKTNLSNIYFNLAAIYFATDEKDQAYDYADKSLSYALDVNYYKNSVWAARKLAYGYFADKEYDKALKYFSILRDENKKQKNYNDYNNALTQIAIIQNTTGDYDDLVKTYEKLIKLKKDQEDEIYEVKYMIEMAKALQKGGKVSESRDTFEEAIAMYNKLPESRERTRVLEGEINNIQNQGSDNEAIKNLKDRIKKIRKTDYDALALANIEVAKIYAKQKNYREAKTYANEALQVGRKAKKVDVIQDVFKSSASIYREGGDNMIALSIFEEYDGIKDVILSKNTARLSDLQRIKQENDQTITDLRARLTDQEKENGSQIVELRKELDAAVLRSSELEELASLTADEREALLRKTNALNQQISETEAVTAQALDSMQAEGMEREDIIRDMKNVVALRAQEAKAQEEAKIYSYIGLVLAGLVALLLLIGFIKNRSKNEQLAKQNEEITKISEEIKKNNNLILGQKDQLEKAYDNIQSLSDFGQRITASLNLDSVHAIVFNYITNLSDNIDSFGIGVHRKDSAEVEYMNFVDKGEPRPNFAHYLYERNSFTVHTFKQQAPVIIQDYENEWKNYLSREPKYNTEDINQSRLYFPLTTDKKIGVMTVQSRKKNAFGENDINILRSLASYVAIALDNANAYEQINLKNVSITDSIRYAETIQKAILPQNRALSSSFEDQFVLFKPKDIVSGDYYWYSYIDTKTEAPELAKQGISSMTFIAAVDCTGHGVPGAFMSLIGNTMLNEIVNTKGIYDPSVILEMLNERIIEALRQEDKANDDGMDVCLCAIARNGGDKAYVTFTGAKRPLYYKAAGTDSLMEIKGDNRSIGGLQRKGKQFTRHNLTLEKGSLLYLCTDGIADQNNRNRKKFGSIKLKQLLQDNMHKPLEKQKEIIMNALEDHQQDVAQRDDITVVGIQV